MTAEKTEQQQRAEAVHGAREQMSALVTMLRSPGWELFVKQCDTAADQSYRQMVSADEAHNAAKFMGAYHAVKQLLEWPGQQLAALEQYVKLQSGE